MERHRKLRIIFGLICPFLFLLLLAAVCLYFRTRWIIRRRRSYGSSLEMGGFHFKEAEELVVFAGGEHLRIQDILDAPGEVVGKSTYGTLYKAGIAGDEIGDGCVAIMLLRFIRPVCIGRSRDILPVIREMGCVRNPNLVPLRALYVGPKGEKLFVHPFYSAGNLAQFLKGKRTEDRWDIIHKISLGIARGLNHLHNGLQKPLIHGNLKSKNVLLDASFQPQLSDFGLHLLLSPAAAQEMLEALAAQGYKAPELIKMKDATEQTDIYSFGIVLLEMITRMEAASCRILAIDCKFWDEFSSDLINGGKEKKSCSEEIMKMYELAMACCSSSPALRPDIKLIIRKLEVIGVQ
ncbi:Putative kinase-like protein TMKL1 [Apostasia shenzhenica]|uniref:Kinase-like protein TMKL1 n=1 Tax=Apostasia shenzhenica TaxID=1088818 RepID=A0A2H9ZZR3_9ASPA|nr:Putative kinase-like protein TMKL1 [Apostasia shenzhenica]